MTVAQTQALLLEGVACTGEGTGAGFTQLEWVRREFLLRLGFEPYPGTFNLLVGGTAWEEAQRVMAKAQGISIAPEPGYCAAKCFPVVVAGQVTGALVLPRVPDYPADKLEVISAVPVRQTLGLRDGDRVALSIIL
jgi:CTP-dependent riboflavin kinase